MSKQTWDERYGTDELIWKAEPNRFLVEELDTLAPGRALDVACGEGRKPLWLAAKGWQVTAVDFSEPALAKGRTHRLRARPRSRIRRGRRRRLATSGGPVRRRCPHVPTPSKP